MHRLAAAWERFQTDAKDSARLRTWHDALLFDFLGLPREYCLSHPFLPEVILGPAGYLDDIALAAYVLNRTINAGNGEIAKEHWAGDGNILEIIQFILA